MPYINLDGKLVEVTQEQYDIYTVGQNRNQVSTPQTPAEAAAAVAAGGTVLNNNTSTTPILTPNTTNTSPGQTLTTSDVQAAVKQSLAQDTAGTVNNTTTVSASQVEQAPAEVSNTSGYGEQNETQSTTSSTKDPKSYTPAELDAIAEAQGVAGEQGNVTADSLSKSPRSYTPAELDAIAEAQGVSAGDGGNIPESALYRNENDAAAAKTAAVTKAKQQQTLKEQRNQSNNGDWRLKISLAPQADYLYKLPVGQANGAGILAPLKETDGVIFPYTPSVQMNYKANYNPLDLTHSNNRGYFYQNSYVDAITINATFTAQSTFEAEYLLAVIHFFRSVTKMFYGQDTQRGSPPPLVYLTGLGEYQFNRHACVVQNFAYTLPPDVDYIRARSKGQAGLNLTTRRDRQSQAPVNTGFSVLNRLQTAFLSKGAEKKKPSPTSLGVDSATYVPTKLDIQLSLLPMQSRSEISQQFSLKQFANGDLLKGGFW